MVAALEKVARHKKRQQKTLDLWAALKEIVDRYDVITVRGVYYQAETAGIIGKTENDYDRVQRALLDMRREGVVPYHRVIDNSRERRGVLLYQSMGEALDIMQRSYRRDYWQRQPTHVEVWCEKDALTAIFLPVCRSYGVTFAALKGFDSESFIYVCAEDIKKVRKPAHVYYFGDHDPSGWTIASNLEQRLRGFGANVKVTHAAVHPWQIRDWQLPTREAKRSDKRLPGFLKHFGSDRCVEVDAIPPDKLRQMAADCIESEITDRAQWDRMAQVERAERETLATYVAALEGQQ